jgi:hypothetical protein
VDIASDVIRSRLEGMTTDQLKAMVSAREGEFTPEALMAARAVLEARGPEPEPPEAPDREAPSSQGFGSSIAGIASFIAAVQSAKGLFRFWQFSEKHPEQAQSLVLGLFSNPWIYVAVLGGALWAWLRRR